MPFRKPELTITPVSSMSREGRLLHVAARDDLDDLAAEFLGKGPVAVVMGRDGHDRAGAVGHEDIVGDEDGDLLAVDGVDGLGRPPGCTPVFSLFSSVRSKSDLRGGCVD